MELEITGPKTARGTTASNIIALDLVEEARNVSIIGDNGACTNRKSREDKCSNDMPSVKDRVHLIEPICYGCRLKRK